MNGGGPESLILVTAIFSDGCESSDRGTNYRLYIHAGTQSTERLVGFGKGRGREEKEREKNEKRNYYRSQLKCEG